MVRDVQRASLIDEGDDSHDVEPEDCGVVFDDAAVDSILAVDNLHSCSDDRSGVSGSDLFLHHDKHAD